MNLTAQDEAVTSGKLAIRVHVRYDGLPNGENRPIIVQIHSKFFEPTAYGHYQIFSNPQCTAESRLPCHAIYVTMRAPRDEHGRFIQSRDKLESIDDTWICLRSEDQVAYDVVLDLASNRGWRETIQSGKDYWLRYSTLDASAGLKLGLSSWRFGTLEVSKSMKCHW